MQQAHREDRIEFTSLKPWPGRLVCAEGRYVEGATAEDDASGTERRAAVFVGHGVRHRLPPRPSGGGPARQRTAGSTC